MRQVAQTFSLGNFERDLRISGFAIQISDWIENGVPWEATPVSRVRMCDSGF